jgi:hypothetical protein
MTLLDGRLVRIVVLEKAPICLPRVRPMPDYAPTHNLTVDARASLGNSAATAEQAPHPDSRRPESRTTIP